MKKIFTSLLLISLFFNLFFVNNTQAVYVDDYYTQELDTIKLELKDSKNGNNYINKIDSFIENNKNNEKLLSKLYQKIDDVIYETEFKNNETENIIYYLYYKTYIEILNIEDSKNSEILSSTISNEDKEIAKNKIYKLQQDLYNMSKKSLDKVYTNFSKTNNKTETGDIKINLDINNETYGNLKSSFELNNYEANTYNFDSKVKGEFKALIEAIPKGEDAIKLQIKSIVDLVSKDGNIYLLLQDFNILNKDGTDKIKTYLDKLEKVVKENKYIKYEDNNNKLSYEILKSLNYTNIESDLKTTLNKPLFEAYNKIGDKYYLRPTKFACDKMKEISNKFDPFNGKECSETQYNDLLKDFNKSGKIYLTISGNNSIIGFEGKLDGTLEKNSGYISFNDNEILEINYEIIPEQSTYPDEFFKFNFKNKQSIKLNFYADKGDIDVNFDSKLNQDNNFLSYKLNGKTPEFNIVSELNNYKITGDFNYTIKGYDYDTGEYIDKSYISGNIVGNTNYQNKINNLSVDYKGKDLIKNIENLSGKISINNNEFLFKNNYNGEFNKNIIDLNGKLDTNYLLNDLNLKIDSQKRNGNYDYDTYEYIYDDNFTPNFNVNLTINNKNITGKTFVYNQGKTFFEINTSGDYSTEKIDIKNNFKINDENLNRSLGNNITGNLNIKGDFSENKYNMYLLFDLLSNSGKIINFEIENNSNITPNNKEIKTPTNTIDYKDAFDIKDYNDNYYYDDGYDY
ncbi:MAG: hypothetical protein PHH98_04400 [Candidatus Gracilibacteria bacterium]|nr:hypothetical protein [Candidatus Gracilibacteria bacterium]